MAKRPLSKKKSIPRKRKAIPKPAKPTPISVKIIEEAFVTND